MPARPPHRSRPAPRHSRKASPHNLKVGPLPVPRLHLKSLIVLRGVESSRCCRNRTAQPSCFRSYLEGPKKRDSIERPRAVPRTLKKSTAIAIVDVVPGALTRGTHTDLDRL